MAPNTFEVATILTAFSICTMLAIYVYVLRKNGWLASNSRFYRCPNLGCKKIFQKPIELKDLSETPTRVYSACPYCGTDLEPLLASKNKKTLGIRATSPVHHKKTEIKTEDPASNIENRKLETVRPTESSGKEILKTVEIKPQIATENRENPVEIIVTTQPTQESGEKPNAILKEPQQSHLQDRAPREETATSNTKSEFSDNSHEGCPHFFGYLRNLPKGSIAPDNCYSCPIMVDCYAIDRAAIDRSLRSLARVLAGETHQ